MKEIRGAAIVGALLILAAFATGWWPIGFVGICLLLPWLSYRAIVAGDLIGRRVG